MTIREAVKVPLHLALRTLFIGGGYAMIAAGDLDQWLRERRKRKAKRS